MTSAALFSINKTILSEYFILLIEYKQAEINQKPRPKKYPANNVSGGKAVFVNSAFAAWRKFILKYVFSKHYQKIDRNKTSQRNEIIAFFMFYLSISFTLRYILVT